MQVSISMRSTLCNARESALWQQPCRWRVRPKRVWEREKEKERERECVWGKKERGRGALKGPSRSMEESSRKSNLPIDMCFPSAPAIQNHHCLLSTFYFFLHKYDPLYRGCATSDLAASKKRFFKIAGRYENRWKQNKLKLLDGSHITTCQEHVQGT